MLDIGEDRFVRAPRQPVYHIEPAGDGGRWIYCNEGWPSDDWISLEVGVTLPSRVACFDCIRARIDAKPDGNV
jgi:hypothetical protein